MTNEIMLQRIDGINQLLADQGAAFRAELTSVYKPNTGEMDGYVLKPVNGENGIAQPIMYWEPVMAFMDDEDLADQMIRMFSRRPSISLPEFTADLIAERVMPKVLSEDCADNLIRHDIPFVRIPGTDLVSVFYLPVDGMDGTVTITKEILAHIPMSVDAVYRHAGRNAVSRMTVCSMFAALAGLMDMEEPEDTGSDGLYVVTAGRDPFGAGVMAGGKAAYDRMGEAIHASSFFILPSSIHELLLVRDDGAFTFEALLEMVTEINETQVAPKDRLTDNVYHYDCRTGQMVHCK